MGTATTAKPTNPSQLSVELGRVALRVRQPTGGNPGRVEVPDLADAQVRAGVDAHVANPDWVDPNPPPSPPPSVEDTARARLRALKQKGWANLTAAERTEVAQRILEALG